MDKIIVAQINTYVTTGRAGAKQDQIAGTQLAA